VYKPPCAIFGQVDAVFESRVLAEVNVMTTTEFSRHYHGYIVETTTSRKIVTLSSLHNLL